MKFSETWLRAFVNPALSSAALGERLTMAGLEVEAIEPLRPAFTGVVVAEVISVARHPNADRLSVCQVDAGRGEALQIVCGAPNVVANARVACALPGATLAGLTIKPVEVRGVASRGMLCSERELGLSEDAAGIMLLPAAAPIGSGLADYLDLNDCLFGLKLTPNRGDCLSVLGVAREVSALTDAPLNLPSLSHVAPERSDARAVTLEAAGACPLYCGRFIELTDPTATTPLWMRHRLERAGLRPISAIVDVTNYVMLELGQPLHAFDDDKLRGGIAVRWAKARESLRLLNEQNVELTEDMLMITDESGVIALAGIMGGEVTAVSTATKRVFLEAAFFAPSAVAGRARRLNLTSDASHRFERGVDFSRTRDAIERATALILEVCGGCAGPITEARAALPSRAPVKVRTSRIARLLGTSLSNNDIGQIFDKLGFEYAATGEAFEVIPPAHRFDLTAEADFAEEVARIRGYERIPSTLPEGGSGMHESPETERELRDLASTLVDRDYQEIVTYSFVDAELETAFAGGDRAPVLRNPIASQMAVMRTSLAPGLIETLRFNLSHKQERVRVFELGRCFVLAEGRDDAEQVEGYAQPLRIGGLCFGPQFEAQWGVASRSVDFFDVKGDISALIGEGDVQYIPAQRGALHPGRAAEILLRGRHVGWLGELHPKLRQRLDLPASPVLFELDAVAAMQVRIPKAKEVSKFPPVRRDFAIEVDEAVPVGALRGALLQAAPAVVTEVAVFDLYRGQGLSRGKKSLAFRVVMHDTEKTLAENEIEGIVSGLVQALTSRYNAQLRS
jgi:phenylalanyl-tRNA synthetase beta chain